MKDVEKFLINFHLNYVVVVIESSYLENYRIETKVLANIVYKI